MFELSFIWAGIIAFAVLTYVLLDGFDLGVGILFPFAKNEQDKATMMNSIAPIWDGNETWLVLGGGGIICSFPTCLLYHNASTLHAHNFNAFGVNISRCSF